MDVCMYASFISGSTAHVTNKQTNEHADRKTDRQKQTWTNYNANYSNT